MLKEGNCMRKKFILFLSCISIVVFIFTGCTLKEDLTKALEGGLPEGDPKQVMDEYYKNMKEHNYESAYDMLAEASKKNFQKIDFIYFNKISNELGIRQLAQITKSIEYRFGDLDGIKYKYVVEYSVMEIHQDLIKDQPCQIWSKIYVVDDQGSWKIYRGNENSGELIDEISARLASLYQYGNGGKPKDLNMAASVLNDTLRYCKDCPIVYHKLGIIYMELKRYDDALDAIDHFLLIAKDNNDKSDGYNVKGCVFLRQNQMYVAREYFNKALELNPDNKYAKSNLTLIK